MDSAVKLSLRSFDDGIQEAYARLFAGDPDKGPATLDWRFNKNPHGPAKFAVATDGGRVVGMIALIPTLLRSGDQRVLGYQAIDTIVDPACRGQGLFAKLGALAQDARQLGGSILWGLPNANAAPGWYGRLGWRNFGPVPMLIRPLRSGFILGRLHSALRTVDLPLIGRSHDRFDLLQEEVQGFNALWDEIAAGIGTSVDRAGGWLHWRLFDKPRTNYRVVGSHCGDKLEAIVATRLADKHGAKLCYVMDAIAPRGGVGLLTTVLKSELARSAEGGVEAALAWCPHHAPNYPAYRKAGFLPFPARLRPVEINFGARAIGDEGTIAVAAPWTISLLDSDTN